MSSEIKVDTISENTSANGVAIDSVTLKDGGIDLADSKPLRLGTGNDLSISFDGTDSIMDHTPGSGGFYIRGDNVTIQDSQSSPNQFVRMDQGSGVKFNDGGLNHDFTIEGLNGAFTNADRFVFADASAGRFSLNSPDGSPTVNFHCYNPHSDGYIAKFENTHTNAGQYGLNIKFAAAPDNNSQHAFVFEDTSATRFKVWADGDAQNHDGHFSTLSDERIKESITDANSQWDDIKALKFKNFKLKDDVRQYGADKANKHLGLIAQEVELVSPNLVKSYPPNKEHIISDSVFGTLYEDGDDIPEDKIIGDIKTEGENVKGLKQSIVFMKGMKALQEAMTRIEELETKVKALEDNQ